MLIYVFCLLIVFYHRRCVVFVIYCLQLSAAKLLFFFDICKEISEKVFRKRGVALKMVAIRC